MFSEELKRFGLDGNSQPLSETEALAYCKRLTQQHYENFSVAGWLLPKKFRQPFQVIYAYCRWSDDLSDEHDGSNESRIQSLEYLCRWEQGLHDCFQRDKPAPNHPVYIALRKIIEQFPLPKQPFADLLVAFRRDQVQNRYATFDELLDYCRYSANPVGRIILHLVCETEPTPEQLTWSDSICTGLQLANFWQDVARDTAIGRCYIPQSIAELFEVDIASLRDSSMFRKMIQYLVTDARSRLQAGFPLVDSVPKTVRTDIVLFIRGGLAILNAIEKNNCNVLIQRPTVSRWTKFCLLVNTWLCFSKYGWSSARLP
ncbi:MAG: squalene synthase HpnC [Planctomycetaceae bacterium]|jgi:squalene synthase HpnC|nr:squalene synthase HpnC [Planctomycetaceae bacterium]